MDPDLVFRDQLYNVYGHELKSVKVSGWDRDFTNKLQIIRKVQCQTVAQVMMSNQLFEKKFEILDADRKPGQAMSVANMKAVNQLNWQYSILHKNGRKAAI